MLTIFSIPKPFVGHIATIQRNAIRSWTLLHPDVEVILFGDEPGTPEAARDLRVRQEAEVLKNEYGTPLLDFVFDCAQRNARRNLVCYVNCDIILMSDFLEAARRVSEWKKDFLMVGRRCDVNIAQPCDLAPDWEQRLRNLALRTGAWRSEHWIDYFVFPRGMYSGKMQPFAIGRLRWDNWLLWKTRSLDIPIVDASKAVLAIHQNHEYSQHPQGKKGLWQSDEAKRNMALVGDGARLYTIADASHVLADGNVRINFGHFWTATKRAAWNVWRVVWFDLWKPVWFAILGVTRPVRERLGLRQNRISGVVDKLGMRRGTE